MPQRTGHERCIIPGCSLSSGSLHGLPKEKHVAERWVDFVYGDLPRPVLNQSFRVCTAHFTSDCIENKGLYDAGVVSKLILKKGSVPTIRDPSTNNETGIIGGTSGFIPAVRHVASQTDPPETKYANTQLSMETLQRKNPERKSVATQLSMRTMQNHFRSKATQVKVSSRDCGVCTLTFPLDSPLLFLQPTIVKRHSKRPRLSLTDEEEGPSASKLSVVVLKTDDST